jgi:hypothetical protein
MSDSTVRTLSALLIALGVGVAATTLLGPLAFGVIEYHVVDDVLNQIVGGDAVGLLLVAPAAVAAGMLVLRGHRAGPVLALAPAGYALYTYVQLTIGGEFMALPGNSERFFPLFLAIVLTAGAAFALAWRAVDPDLLPDPSRAMRRTAVAVLLLLAVFLTLGFHLPGVIDVVSGEPHGIEYTQSPTVFLIVKLMDLGLVVPLALVAAVGLLRGVPSAKKLMYTVIGWGALLGSAVASMGVVMVVNDDPAASVGGTAVFVLFALAFLALAGWILRPLFSLRTTPARPDRPVAAGTVRDRSGR